MIHKRSSILAGIICVVMLASLVFMAACSEEAPAPAPTSTPTQSTPSSPAPAPAPAPSPAPAPAPAPASTPAATKPIELKLATFTPAQADLMQLIQKWADMIGEQSNGRVKISCYFGNSLLNIADMKRGGQAGLADIIHWVANVTSDEPANSFIRLPFLGLPDVRTGTTIYRDLLDEFSILRADYGLKLYAPTMMPPTHLHMVKKNVHVPEDLRGTKLIAGSEYLQLLSSVDAVPLKLSPPDWFTSLERGLAEGHFVQFAGSAAQGCQELFSYHIMFGDSGCAMQPYMLCFNQNSWNKLPSDVQDNIMGLEDWFTEQAIVADEVVIDNVLKQDTEWGHTFTYITPEELEIWKEANKGSHEQWIEEYGAKGIPAQEIMDEVVRLEQQYANK